jgi:hypothetical protein
MLLFVLAAGRWAAGAAMVGWLTVAGLVVLAGLADADNPKTGVTEDGPVPRPRIAVRHPAFDPARLRLWGDCWRADLPRPEYRRRMRAAAMVTDFHSAADWVELGEVADWLAAQGVRDGEVLAWHDSPHAVYLELGTRPGIRFMHVFQMMGVGDAQSDRIKAEVCRAAPGVRFVVTDLKLPAVFGREWVGDVGTAGGDLLPDGMSADLRAEFPFDQPAVFRSGGGTGRYVVHALTEPIPWCEE